MSFSQNQRAALSNAKLTHRETQCVVLACYDCWTRRMIAKELELSRGRVDDYIRCAKKKLAHAGLRLRDVTRKDDLTICSLDPMILAQVVGVD